MQPVTVNDILQAGRRIAPHVQPQPLRHSPYLSAASGADVWLKLENLQPTGSFKIRGALHKLSRLSAADAARGVIAASAGNHGLGVAYAAGALGGVAATIVVPRTAPRAKLDKLRRFPVVVREAGETYEAAHQAAAALAAEHGLLEISAYDDPDVIAGQGTVGLEIAWERPSTQAILVPIGGGGLLAGLSVAASGLLPDCQLMGVQPAASPAAQLSYRDGVAYDPYEHAPTIADGLAGGFGRLPFALTRDRPPRVLLADEAALRQAVYALLAHEQLVVEPSGAISIVPLLRREPALVGRTVVCVLSGGNLDAALLRQIVAAPEAA